MIDVLGLELVTEVLQHLPKVALRAAREASLLLDSAGRQLVETLTLTPHDAGRDSGVPNWSRFPKLKTLRLQGWCQPGSITADKREQHHSRLLECFATPAAATSLSGVEVLDMCSSELGPHMVALLRTPLLKLRS